MCEPDPWHLSFSKALTLQSVHMDSRVRSGCLACLKCICSGTRTVQSITWAKLTCFSTHTCTCIWFCRTAFVWAACMYLQAQMDWKSRGFALLDCAIASVKRELTARGNCCWGVSGGNRRLSAMDTSHTHFGWGSISYRYTAQLHLHDFPCRFMSPLKQVTLWQVRDLG